MASPANLNPPLAASSLTRPLQNHPYRTPGHTIRIIHFTVHLLLLCDHHYQPHPFLSVSPFLVEKGGTFMFNVCVSTRRDALGVVHRVAGVAPNQCMCQAPRYA